MPRLIEKKDMSRVVSDFERMDRVWQEDVSESSGVVSISLPELGMYRVFLVKVDGEKNHDPNWHDIPVSPLVEEITGVIPDEDPKRSYREMLSDAIGEKYLTRHEAVR